MTTSATRSKTAAVRELDGVDRRSRPTRRHDSDELARIARVAASLGWCDSARSAAATRRASAPGRGERGAEMIDIAEVPAQSMKSGDGVVLIIYLEMQ